MTTDTKHNQTTQDTIKIRDGVYESLSNENKERNGINAGFFHSLGRAIQGAEVDNEFLKANKK